MVVGEFAQEAELVIIGGGPAGYEAAFHAAQQGQQVTLIDPRDDLGGRCLHEACIPSKLLATRIRMAFDGAINMDNLAVPAIPQTHLLEVVNGTVAQLASALSKQANTLNVTIVRGEATFQDGRNLAVSSDPPLRLKFRRALIATGATANAHQALDHKLPGVCTPSASWLTETKNKRVLVVGEEVVALEVGSILAELGGLVTLVDLSTAHCHVDPELQRPAMRRLRELGVTLNPTATLDGCEETDGALRVEMTNKGVKETNDFDLIVDCTAPGPNSSELGLEKAGVANDANGFIKVDAQQRTTNPRIFAAGDITGPPFLASRAAYQGRVVIDAIANLPVAFDPVAVPWTIYTNPPMAGCGLSNADAERAGIPNASAKRPWGASGLAAAQGRTDGVTKLVYDTESGLLLGGFISGVGAAEMIQEIALALELGATMEDLAATVHAHPTRSELVAMCAQDAVRDLAARSAS